NLRVPSVLRGGELLPSSQRLVDRIREHLETGAHVVAEMHAQRAAAAVGEHLKITARLRRLDDAKGELLPGHGQIDRVVAGDLQEDAARRPAFVGLTGGVKKTRTEADTGRHPFRIAYTVTHAVEQPLVGAVH